MKKILLILAGVFTMFVLSCGGLFFFAAAKNADVIGDFFKLVATGNPDPFLAQCTPELAKQLERPLVEKWMSTVNTSLGAYQDTSLNGFEFNTSWNDGIQRSEASGVANFEKGTANVSLVYVDGKVAAIEFNSKQMTDAWFLKLEDTSFYQLKAQEFLQRMVDGDSEALYAELHPALKSVKPLEAFQSDVAAIRQWGGKIEEIQITGDAFDDIQKGQVLRVKAELRGERATLPASVKFEFTGMAAPILGYGVDNPNETAKP